jgi:hypothetical protein
MVLATPASGDEIKLFFNSYIGSYAPTPPSADEANAWMATYPGSSQVQNLGGGASDSEDNRNYSFPAFTVPAGRQILSARMTLSFATEQQYSYEPSVLQVLPPPDPDQASVTGRILATVTTRNTVGTLFAGGCELESQNNFQNFDLMQQGCDPLTNGILNVLLIDSSFTEIVPTALDLGFNSAETFYMEGGNTSPITGELDITLTPEPSPLTLIGTGMMLLLATIAFRRRARATPGPMTLTNG